VAARHGPAAATHRRGAAQPKNRVHCAGGYRSSIAASILNQHGITNLVELAGGIAAWEAAGLAVVTG